MKQKYLSFLANVLAVLVILFLCVGASRCQDAPFNLINKNGSTLIAPRYPFDSFTTGAFNAQAMEGVQYCDQFAGADIGAKCNAAYAALPSTGGRIFIPSGTYSFSTPMVFSTNNKPVTLECPTNTQLTFTPTSGTAVTIDTGIIHRTPTGIIGCTIYGPGAANTDILVNFPNVNGAENALIRDAAIGKQDTAGNQGATCVNVAPGQFVFMMTIQKTYVGGCTTGISNVQSGGGNSSESMRLWDDIVFRNGTGLSIAGAVDAYIVGGSFDDNPTAGISCTTGTVNGFGVHFENAGLGASQYFSGGCLAAFYGGQWLEDNTTGTQAQMATVNGSQQFVMDGVFVQTSGRTVTQVVNITAGAVLMELRLYRSGANLGPDYTLSGGAVTAQDFTWSKSGFTLDQAGSLTVNSKLCAGGACSTGSVTGDVTAARTSTTGQVFVGSDGTTGLFRSGATNLLLQSGGNQTFPTVAGTVADAITATSAAFATATTAGTCVQNTTAVTGATTAMAVQISPVSTAGVGAQWSAYVSSAGNVTINECAVAASAGGTIAFNIRVIQ